MGKNIKPRIRAYISLVFLMVVIILIVIIGYFAIEHKDKSFTSTSMVMGVQARQILYGADSEIATAEVKKRIEEIENIISYDIDGSDIDRINRGAGEKWVRASDETVRTLHKVISIAKKSRGVIDPTSLPLVSLWGLDSEIARSPEDYEIKNLLNEIDYRDIKINYDVNRVKIDKENSKITLKYVEKGVICDSAIDIYKNLKIDYGIISVGGLVGVYGNKPDNSLWKISIRDPFSLSDEDAKIASVKIQKGYVASFGVEYDKININGSWCNRLLDLKTGYPVKNDIALVSIVHSDAVVSDALSKVCCCLGKKDSMDILNYYGAEAIFVYNDKSIHVTPNLKKDFMVSDNNYRILED